MNYLTVEREASDSFVEKRSEFIGYIKPVKTEKHAVEFINEIKQKHWDAKHNVYAYILRDGQIKRYSDDGEPQGTAGVPVLDVLQKNGICDCCVVVTRYFGGILLGGGGLVRAYSHAASLAVNAGNVIKMELCNVCKMSCDYTLYGKIPGLISEHGGKIISQVFEDDIKLEFFIPAPNYQKFTEDLTNLSLGKGFADIIGEEFCRV
ncbi:MAG: YigZ family protein [Oscillospiraceae bacterium]|nr:YigZ family protein [Oscillospiraceae bacterium]